MICDSGIDQWVKKEVQRAVFGVFTARPDSSFQDWHPMPERKAREEILHAIRLGVDCFPSAVSEDQGLFQPVEAS